MKVFVLLAALCAFAAASSTATESTTKPEPRVDPNVEDIDMSAEAAKQREEAVKGSENPLPELSDEEREAAAAALMSIFLLDLLKDLAAVTLMENILEYPNYYGAYDYDYDYYPDAYLKELFDRMNDTSFAHQPVSSN